MRPCHKEVMAHTAAEPSCTMEAPIACFHQRSRHAEHLVCEPAGREAQQHQAKLSHTSNDTQHICNAPLPVLPVLRAVYLLVESVDDDLQVMLWPLARNPHKWQYWMTALHSTCCYRQLCCLNSHAQCNCPNCAKPLSQQATRSRLRSRILPSFCIRCKK